MKKRICIFSAFYEPHFGGVERYVKELSLALNKLGYEILIITSNTDNLELDTIEYNLRIIRLSNFFLIDGRLPIPKSMKELSYLKREYKEFSPDLTILNMRIYPISILGAYLSKKFNKKSILIDHVSGYFDFDSPLKKYLSRIYEHLFTKIVKIYTNEFYGVSLKVNKWLENFGIIASGVIYNGVALSDNKYEQNYKNKYNLKKSTFKVLYAGRLLPDKGLMYLVNGFLQFGKSDSELIICGDGPLYYNIAEMKNDNIRLTGKINHSEVMRLLKKADAVVIPSFYPEGLPTLILEAGASKCVVITTDSGGALEVINDKFNGLVIPKRSSDEISDALNSVYFDFKLKNKLSQNLYNTIEEKFTWKKIAEELSKKV